MRRLTLATLVLTSSIVWIASFAIAQVNCTTGELQQNMCSGISKGCGQQDSQCIPNPQGGSMKYTNAQVITVCQSQTCNPQIYPFRDPCFCGTPSAPVYQFCGRA